MADFSSYAGTDEQWEALVKAGLPPRPSGLSVEEMKTQSNAEREHRAAEEMKLLAPKVHMQTFDIPTRDGQSIQARSYRPVSAEANKKLPVYMYLHGGGFIFGTLSSEDAICTRIAINAEVVVFNVNYRHTPEFPYPTAWDDTADAFDFLHDHIGDFGGDPDKVVIGGISAGGQLSTSFALQKHLGLVSASRPALAGQILMVPVLIHIDCYEEQLKKLVDPSVSSYVANKDAPALNMAVARWFSDLLKVEDPKPDDTKLNPGLASVEQLRGMPPTVIAVSGLDLLRDEGLLYGKSLHEAG